VLGYGQHPIDLAYNRICDRRENSLVSPVIFACKSEFDLRATGVSD
jgi:hypothetical protein